MSLSPLFTGSAAAAEEVRDARSDGDHRAKPALPPLCPPASIQRNSLILIQLLGFLGCIVSADLRAWSCLALPCALAGPDAPDALDVPSLAGPTFGSSLANVRGIEWCSSRFRFRHLAHLEPEAPYVIFFDALPTPFSTDVGTRQAPGCAALAVHRFSSQPATSTQLLLLRPA